MRKQKKLAILLSMVLFFVTVFSSTLYAEEPITEVVVNENITEASEFLMFE